MKRTLAYALFAFGAGCGAETLDLGGIPDGSPGGSLGDGSVLPSWPVTGQKNPRSLRSEGTLLYWIADRGEGCDILRCEKRNCSNTIVPVVQVESPAIAAIDVRGDTLYAVDSRSIFSCPTGGCSKLKTIVPGAEASAVTFDEASVYWSHRDRLAIYSCPLAGCQQGTVVENSDRTDAIELAVSEAKLYWVQGEEAFPNRPGSVRVASKDGSTTWSTFAGGQNQAASLTIRNGFVYWTTSFSVGTIARCPLAGCAGARPEILASNLDFPHFVDPAGDMIFWMNGATGPGDARPVEILGCQAADCEATLEVLDQGLGASSGTRNPTFPPRELVVDDEAIYWIGDIVNVGPTADGGVAVVGSVRRTERRRVR